MATNVIVAAATSTMMLGTKSTPTPPKLTTATATKPTPAFLSLQNLPKGLAFASQQPPFLPSLTSSAIAAAVFSSLSSADAALAVQQIADIADGDSRGIALLIPIVPAIGWVLFNILQPALNQINRMRSVKGIAIGLGLGLGLNSATSASAGEVAMIAEAASRDNRGLLLLVPVGVAIAWVLFNILQPALNQINKMRSG
ncbi:photosystem II core complex proteins psbY, chloroplastic [Phalaenopsis equestris]|uniref:photosystem II core complex proteins psbY, chloroplastic n=1 Tax=Phalaenopsis equestris TaxID=78828 RepID=UPI0009E43E0E|nr:photosystem II core complex proteins psbY, chloroplastic [Phalaenopsis equestris]